MRLKHEFMYTFEQNHFDNRCFAKIEQANLCSRKLIFWHCTLQYFESLHFEHFFQRVTSGGLNSQFAQMSGISISQISSSSLSMFEPDERETTPSVSQARTGWSNWYWGDSSCVSVPLAAGCKSEANGLDSIPLVATGSMGFGSALAPSLRFWRHRFQRSGSRLRREGEFSLPLDKLVYRRRLILILPA